MRHFVLHNLFKVYVWPIFLYFWLHISFEGIMFDGWRHFYLLYVPLKLTPFKGNVGHKEFKQIFFKVYRELQSHGA